MVGSFLASLTSSLIGVLLHVTGLVDHGGNGLVLSCSATAMVGLFTFFYIVANGARTGMAASSQKWQDHQWQ